MTEKKLKEMRFLFNYPTHAVVWQFTEFEDPWNNPAYNNRGVQAQLVINRDNVFWIAEWVPYPTLERALNHFNSPPFAEDFGDLERFDLSTK